MDTKTELEQTKAELELTKHQLDVLRARIKRSEDAHKNLEKRYDTNHSWVIQEMARHDAQICQIFKELDKHERILTEPDEHERLRKKQKQGSGAHNPGLDPNRYLQHFTLTNMQEFNPFMVSMVRSTNNEC